MGPHPLLITHRPSPFTLHHSLKRKVIIMEKRNFIDLSGEDLLIGGYSLSDLERNYSLPLHILYSPVIRENLRNFKKVFEELYPKGLVCYAAKASTGKKILETVKEEGCGADVASYNEVRCALEAKIPPEKLALNGNTKEDFLIEKAIGENILIVCDNVEEFKLISEISSGINKKARVILRISGYQLEDVTSENIFTAGLWTKFGMALKDIPDFIKTLDSYPSVDFLGFHTHIGSQIADVEPYLEVMGKLIELGHLLKNTGRECKIIDLGGGYPLSYVDKKTWIYILKRIIKGLLKAEEGDISKIFLWNNNRGGFERSISTSLKYTDWRGEKFYSPFPKEKMLEAIMKSEIKVNGKFINTVQALRALGEPLLIIEPGRSVVEDGGISLAKCGTVRKIADHHNLITLEMGITEHSEALMEIPLRRWAIGTDHNKKDKKPFETFVGGNLCFSGDMISRYKIFLRRKPSRGDIILIYDTGAYSSGFMQANCNSFPRAGRIVIDEHGEISVLKKKDAYEEIFREY